MRADALGAGLGRMRGKRGRGGGGNPAFNPNSLNPARNRGYFFDFLGVIWTGSQERSMVVWRRPWNQKHNRLSHSNEWQLDHANIYKYDTTRIKYYQ